MPIKDFRGGLNTRDSPFELQANESPDLSNVTVSALVGQLEARKGKTRYDVSGLPETEKIDYAKQVVVGTEKRALMLSINGSIWFCNAAGEVKKLFKGTAGSIWNFTVYADAAFKDWVYCQNGVDLPQKWDAEAAATVEWKATVGGIPRGSIITVWENRMFISGEPAHPQRIFFSEFGDPEATIKEYGFIDVRGEEDDLDTVRDIHVLGARLIVLKRRSVFFISSAVTMANRRIGGPGVWDRFQTVELEDKLYFFNPQGIWTTGGVEVSMESGSINNYFPKHLNKAVFSAARLIATKDTYPRLMLSVATGVNTSPDTLIEMVPHINFRRIGGRRYLLLPAFFLHTLPAQALATWNPTGTEELLIGAGFANSTAGKTSFPVLAITDSFERANENPLSNAGAWVQFNGATRPKLLENVVTPSAFAINNCTRYTPGGEITNPAVELEFLKGSSEPLESATLYACLGATEAFNNGYEAKFQTKGNELILRKKVGGIETLLGGSPIILPKFLAPGTRLGLTVFEGKIKVWWNVSGKGWEVLLEAADASFTKGFSGIAVSQLETATQPMSVINFRTGAIPTITNRLSTLFTGTTDEGAEIAAYWHSSWMSLQGDEPKERIRRLNVELQGDGVLDVFTDFSELPRFSSTIPKGAAEGSEYRFQRVRPETFGRFHSIKLRSLAGGQPFLVNAMEIVYRGGKEH